MGRESLPIVPAVKVPVFKRLQKVEPSDDWLLLQLDKKELGDILISLSELLPKHKFVTTRVFEHRNL